MTIKQAIQELVNSGAFKEDAKEDAKLRVFRQRYNSGMLGIGGAIALLVRYGYTVDVKRKKAAKRSA